MIAEMSAPFITAIATLGAALVTGAISFVNLTMTKELKTSEFRQSWIDGLREDLACFFGSARAFARSVEEVNALGSGYRARGILLLSDEKISDIRYQAAEKFSKIKLRLNPDEKEHKELLRLLKSTIEKQNEMLADGTDASATLSAIEEANEYARPLLKKEWDRVKRGELPFRIARNWLAPAVILIAITVSILIWNGVVGTNPPHESQSSRTTITPSAVKSATAR